MTCACFALSLLLAVSSGLPVDAADPWQPVRFLEGNWTGTARGQAGNGIVHRSYEFVLGYRFLHERNVTAYPPAKAEAEGELHEHRSFFSFDRKRGRLVLRQLHQEGFVNRYVLDPELSGPQKLVFVSEAFENLDARWRARETYEVSSRDEFTETFELAPPGKDLAVYSKSSFRRAKPD